MVPYVFDARQKLVDLVREHRINEIIVAVREQRWRRADERFCSECRIGGVPIMDLAYFYERTAPVPVDSLKATGWSMATASSGAMPAS